MKDIIMWLQSVELLARETYMAATVLHAADRSFAEFLARLVEDESWHYQIMKDAEHVVNDEDASLSAIALDDEIGDAILNYFHEMRRGIADRSLSRERLLELLVRAELSEWNDIFLYVVNVLKERMGSFKYPAAGIQSHIRMIENFVEARGGLSDVLNRLKLLPPIWVEKILIVDDVGLVADLIKALLNRDGDIDIACDGEEGMRMIEKKYYKLVISDIDMPNMNGIDMYINAVRRFPKLKDRFILMSGDITPERRWFMQENKVKYIAKPMKINTLRTMALDILLTK